MACQAAIPSARLEAVPDTRICVACQDKIEKGELDLDHLGVEEAKFEDEPTPIEVEEDRLVAGAWSGGFVEVATQSGQLRSLLREGKRDKAKALVQTMPVEGQAALVLLDENPEEALSLTGMDTAGNPGYSTDVVALLPTEMLTGLIAYDGEEKRFNTELIQSMGPGTFHRAVTETLDPMDNPLARSEVTWEWLEALAALRDANKRAELLRSVEPEVLEEALINRVQSFQLNKTVTYVEVDGEMFGIDMFRLFSEDAAVGVVPSQFIEDPGCARVMDALYEAESELLRRVIRGAWERQFDGWEEL